MELTHFSTFTGIAGFDLAAEEAGFRTIGQVEKNPYRQKVLRKYWPDMPLWEDIRDVTEESLKEAGIQTSTLVTGGFPCQGFSLAGKRRGKADDRYLWPEMFGVIKLLRPHWVLAENVTGIVRMALDTVLSDLESEGYSVQAFNIPACGTNAPHRRERIWIVAYSRNERRGGRCHGDEEGSLRPRQTEGPGSANEQGLLADPQQGEVGDGRATGRTPDEGGRAAQAGREALRPGEEAPQPGDSRQGGKTLADPHNEGLPDREGGEDDAEASRLATPCDGNWWNIEPDVGRVAHGVPHRVDRLAALGDAIVPQVAYQILRAIAQIERSSIER